MSKQYTLIVCAVFICGLFGFYNWPAMRTFTNLISQVRILGNIEVYNDEYIEPKWTNSGVEFRFFGTGVKALVELCPEESTNALLGVFVDDDLVRTTVKVNNGKAEYMLVENLARKWHTIKILKVSEERDSHVRISTVSILNSCRNTQILPTIEKEKVIKFIGDSITCGFGVLAAREDSPYNVLEEDGSLTYAYKIQKELDYDGYYYCRRGAGVLINNDGSSNNTMTDIYMALCDTDREADIVIINLGTNDEVHIVDNVNLKHLFSKRYKELLLKARHNNPTAQIFVFYGAMRTELSELIDQTVEEFNREQKDWRVSFYNYKEDLFSITDGGRSGHPSPKAHEILAQETIDAIRSLQ